MVVSGMLNKQIAGELRTAENTVKVHRSTAMEEMKAQSFADLVRKLEKLKCPLQKDSKDAMPARDDVQRFKGFLNRRVFKTTTNWICNSQYKESGR